MEDLFANFGHQIEDVYEETFHLFSQPIPSQDLGMLDPKATSVEICVAGRDFAVTQSPGVLQSTRGGGTTGAAVWRVSIHFAEWLSSKTNPLFGAGLLGTQSVVLELGAGISPMIACTLSSRVHRVVSTDQSYVLKALRENIDANARATPNVRSSSKNTAKHEPYIDTIPLDWEKDDAVSMLRSNGIQQGVDMIVACDCVYNYALISPLVQTCAEICRIRAETNEETRQLPPTMCVIAQQLRQPDVLEQFLTTFTEAFRVWRVPSEVLLDAMKEESGFVVHIGIIRPAQ